MTLKKISDMLDNDFFNLNFVQDTYCDSTGRLLCCYRLTQDGFIILSANFTGKDLSQTKLSVIKQFQCEKSTKDNTKIQFNTDGLVKEAVCNASSNLPYSLRLIDMAFADAEHYWEGYCIREHIVRDFLNSQHSEKDVYTWFRFNFSHYVDDSWHIVKRKNNAKHIPDFWLSNNVEFAPVECKLHDFDIHALHQLERYMQFYNCSKGWAVAENLKVELPTYIKFIEVDFNNS